MKIYKDETGNTVLIYSPEEIDFIVTGITNALVVKVAITDIDSAEDTPEESPKPEVSPLKPRQKAMLELMKKEFGIGNWIETKDPSFRVFLYAYTSNKFTSSLLRPFVASGDIIVEWNAKYANEKRKGSIERFMIVSYE